MAQARPPSAILDFIEASNAAQTASILAALSACCTTVNAKLDAIQATLGGGGSTAGPFSITMQPVTNALNGSAQANFTVSGTIPANLNTMHVQWSTTPSTGPWPLAGAAATLAVGTFSRQILMNPPSVAAGTTVTVEAIAYNLANPSATGNTLVSNLVTYVVPASGSGIPAGFSRTLLQEWAISGTALNEFRPGVCVGTGSTGNPGSGNWDFSPEFPTAPFGPNNGPAKDRIAGGGPLVTANTVGIVPWPWIMPFYGQNTVDGNWRMQYGFIQVALKLDSITNAWTYLTMVQPGITNLTTFDSFLGANASGPAAPGQLEFCTGATSHDRAISLLPRVEASGGISIKGIGKNNTYYLYEDFTYMSLGGIDAARIKGMCVVVWCRLIPDTGPGPIPSVNLGCVLGADFFGSGGRFGGDAGTGGEGRAITLDAGWKPAAHTMFLHSSGTRITTPEEAQAILRADPPAFTSPS